MVGLKKKKEISCPDLYFLFCLKEKKVSDYNENPPQKYYIFHNFFFNYASFFFFYCSFFVIAIYSD